MRTTGTRSMELALVILAPIAAMLIQFAISRQREFEADRVGAEILGRPLPLANALRRTGLPGPPDSDERGARRGAAGAGQPAGRHGRRHHQLFSTHPPTEERVARLEAMAAGR